MKDVGLKFFDSLKNRFHTFNEARLNFLLLCLFWYDWAQPEMCILFYWRQIRSLCIIGDLSLLFHEIGPHSILISRNSNIAIFCKFVSQSSVVWCKLSQFSTFDGCLAPDFILLHISWFCLADVASFFLYFSKYILGAINRPNLVDLCIIRQESSNKGEFFLTSQPNYDLPVTVTALLSPQGLI